MVVSCVPHKGRKLSLTVWAGKIWACVAPKVSVDACAKMRVSRLPLGLNSYVIQ